MGVFRVVKTTMCKLSAIGVTKVTMHELNYISSKLVEAYMLVRSHLQIYHIAHQCQCNSHIHCLDQYDEYFDPTTSQPINPKLEHLVLAP
jgi:hypothetical protein